MGVYEMSEDLNGVDIIGPEGQPLGKQITMDLTLHRPTVGPDYVNEATSAELIVDLFVETGDIEGALEVFHFWRWGGVTLETNIALAAAANTRIEPRLRAAAIVTIDWLKFRDAATIEALEKLLSDQDRSVRVAAERRLLYLHEGYRRNRNSRNRELTEIWNRVLPRIR